MDANLDIGPLLDHLKQTDCTLSSLEKSIIILERLNPVINKKLTAALKKQPKPNAKAWSFKEKVYALLVYKKFTKSYQILCKVASLPRANELNEVLKSIPVTTGINSAAVNNLKNIAKGVLNDEEELVKDKELTCSLIFHKLDLQPHIQYNEAEDRIDGFVDFGDERARNFANAAILFIIEGLYTNFSQPISMYFVNDELSSVRLSKLIKQNVTAVQGTGFKVMTTICSSTVDNVAALNILSGNAERNYFECDSKKIYIMYDVAHLFKCIRDHFFEYGQIKLNGVMAKWSHIVKYYEAMKIVMSFFGKEEYENHVKPCDQKTVSYAVQTLSCFAAVGIHQLALEEENKKIRKEMKDTSAVLFELDKLLDLTNGPANREEVIKGQREKVTKKTGHFDKWADLNTKLATVKFVNSDGKEFEEICIKRYITSLNSLSDIWKETEDLGIKKLNLRKLNIERIESIFNFALITSAELTCSSFIVAMKLFAATTLF